ncbi:actin-binding ADF family protein [Streptomyces sp. NPDC054901]
MGSKATVDDECRREFQALKDDRKHGYVVFKLSKDYTQIVVEKVSDSETYDDFVADLPENECRLAVCRFAFERKDGGPQNALLFFSWAPEAAALKQKMHFEASHDELRLALSGIAAEIRGTEYAEVAHDAVLAKALRTG